MKVGKKRLINYVNVSLLFLIYLFNLSNIIKWSSYRIFSGVCDVVTTKATTLRRGRGRCVAATAQFAAEPMTTANGAADNDSANTGSGSNHADARRNYISKEASKPGGRLTVRATCSSHRRCLLDNTRR